MHGCNQRCSVLSDISQESQFVFVVARTEVIIKLIVMSKKYAQNGFYIILVKLCGNTT